MLKTDDLLDQPETNGYTSNSVTWWEDKRLLYNLIVGGYGAFCTIKYLQEIMLIDYLAIFAFGLLANVCYTFGWSVDHVVKYHTSSSVNFYRYRRIFFIAGTVFSLITISLIDLYYRTSGI